MQNQYKATMRSISQPAMGSAVGGNWNARNGNVSEKPAQRRQRVSLNSPPEIFSLHNMPEELSSCSRVDRSSITFSTVSHVISKIMDTTSVATLISLGTKDKLSESVKKDDFMSIHAMARDNPAVYNAAAILCIEQNSHDLLNILLKSADHANVEWSDLLHLAAECGSVECCKSLLNNNFDANSWNADKTETPVHTAAKRGNLECLKVLQNDGNGDLNKTNDKNMSVLHFAVKNGHEHIVKYLLDNKVNTSGKGFTSSPLHLAAELNQHQCASLLLDHKVLIDAMCSQITRETPLHLAAMNGYFEASLLLLKHGANPNARNGNEETPLHLASKALAASVMQALIENGADVNARDKAGRPPLHCAINSKQRGSYDCMKLLLDRGADVNMADDTGVTALHLAAINRKAGRVNLLIAAGAHLCARNNAGKSGLHFMMKHVPGSIQAIEKLLDAGLRLNNAENESSCEIKMEFQALVPMCKSSSWFESEVDLFNEVLRIQHGDPAMTERILMHPLSQGYLHLKWSQIKWLYYILIVASHFIYSITYSAFNVLVYKDLCVVGHVLPANESVLTEEIPCQLNLESNRVKTECALTAWIFLIIFTFIYVVKEITKLAHLGIRYFRDYESVLNFLVVTSFMLVSFHSNPFDFSTRTITVKRWQFHASGVGVFTTWLLQMLLIGRVPRFGKYVEMFMNVTKTFFNFFVAYVFLFISFALSFYILFPQNVAFNTALPATMIKVCAILLKVRHTLYFILLLEQVLVMMLGELEYDDLSYPDDYVVALNTTNSTWAFGQLERQIEQQYFPFTAHVVITLFIMFVSIIIVNLLFGLAVTDIQVKGSRHES